jgi:mutual gliding-motility protein MglA
MLLDIQQRELTIKLVYYGPALSGKTTNLRQLHGRASSPQKGQLLSLDTYADRTIFFDLLGVVFRAAGVGVRLRLYTVPGQVLHGATRRLVLQGADGVAFIADSRIKEIEANTAAYADLKENLRANGVDAQTIPVVIQFNKRDLPEVRSDAELDAIAAVGREPIYRASALRGEGVIETFSGLAALTWDRLEERHRLKEMLGITRDDFTRQLAAQFS